MMRVWQQHYQSLQRGSALRMRWTGRCPLELQCRRRSRRDTVESRLNLISIAQSQRLKLTTGRKCLMKALGKTDCAWLRRIRMHCETESQHRLKEVGGRQRLQACRAIKFHSKTSSNSCSKHWIAKWKHKRKKMKYKWAFTTKFQTRHFWSVYQGQTDSKWLLKSSLSLSTDWLSYLHTCYVRQISITCTIFWL